METHSLILFSHVFLGELGCFAFLWVFVELLNLSESSLERSRKVACLGTTLLIVSWIVGGYYYLTHYGAEVKPLIKAGPQPWAHLVVMEVKEHVFLFLPFLALTLKFVLKNATVSSLQNSKSYTMGLSLLIFIIGMSMAGMGALIANGLRAALIAGGIK